MKIGVYGSADRAMNKTIKEKAQKIGYAIAKSGAILVTGGCPGYPEEAVLGAKQAHGQCIAFSPALDLASHKKLNYPTDGFAKFIFIPKNYQYANHALLVKPYRNVSSVAYVDAAIFISGSIGSMNEFTIAYFLGKTIGVLEKTGGITKRAIKVLLEDLDKKTGAKVIFESDPTKLVEVILRILTPSP